MRQTSPHGDHERGGRIAAVEQPPPSEPSKAHMLAHTRDVRPDGHGGWKVIKPGSRRSSGTFATRDQAAARARQIIANNGGGELRIAGRDGQIRSADKVPRAKPPPIRRLSSSRPPV